MYLFGGAHNFPVSWPPSLSTSRANTHTHTHTALQANAGPPVVNENQTTEKLHLLGGNRPASHSFPPLRLYRRKEAVDRARRRFEGVGERFCLSQLFLFSTASATRPWPNLGLYSGNRAILSSWLSLLLFVFPPLIISRVPRGEQNRKKKKKKLRGLPFLGCRRILNWTLPLLSSSYFFFFFFVFFFHIVHRAAFFFLVHKLGWFLDRGWRG